MKSRITIEVDFDKNNEPFIQIVSHYSEDVRDNLLRNFLNKLENSSQWLKLTYQGNQDLGGLFGTKHFYAIKPIVPKDIPEEIKAMSSITKDTNFYHIKP